MGEAFGRFSPDSPFRDVYPHPELRMAPGVKMAVRALTVMFSAMLGGLSRSGRVPIDTGFRDSYLMGIMRIMKFLGDS